jgi:UDP-3-O-[3-hydroxymyristoyl] glucosamine N-acyltransferase
MGLARGKQPRELTPPNFTHADTQYICSIGRRGARWLVVTRLRARRQNAPVEDARRLTSLLIAEALGLEHLGPICRVNRPSSAAGAVPGSLIFITDARADLLPAVTSAGPVTVIATRALPEAPEAAVILSARPRLDFARALQQYYAEEAEPGIHPTAVIHATVRLGARVAVGPFAVLGESVEVGDGTVIGAGVSVARRTRIGARTVIKPNTVLGEPGYGFEEDEAGGHVRLPHLGAVRIGDDVEIGALVSIARGTLNDTIIEDHVKIDDHVFIAHNVRIGQGSLVIAGAEVSGSVVVGPGCWIGPQVTIRDQLSIGDGALVGIGSVVVKDVPAGMIVVGNPAKVLRARQPEDNR